MPKKLEGRSSSLARYCMLRKKKGKTFWVQFAEFDTIKIRRNFMNYFGQIVCIEKKPL